MIASRLSSSLTGLSFTVLLLSGCEAPPPSPPPLGTVVRTTAGEIEGERLDGEPAVHVYRAVPYAQPPVGELRWRPPEPVEPWDGVRPATELGDEVRTGSRLRMEPVGALDEHYRAMLERSN